MNSMASLNDSASSSSPKPTGSWTYDVFLSFRGEDTRNNFVDHLYAALVQKGIHVFKDDQMIRRGKSICPELAKSIEESRFAVVVFSENYANSSWCLEELVKIMESKDQTGLKVLPVFYHVDPSDVRRHKGSFAASFQEHELNFNGEKNEVKKWREALAAAGCLSGYHISAVSGGEYSNIIKIVQEILDDMQPSFRENNLIGIETHMNTLISLLSIEAVDKVKIIGIFGMGGIGKTTIARALFRRIAYKFEGSSFINDVRENSVSKRDICALQERLLRDILVAHHGFIIQDPEYGADMIRERLNNKKVLLVLDDVNDVKQLEFLAATHDSFGAGSRIIITTRDEHMLTDANAKYKPALLRLDEAVELFSRHAFRKNSPPNGFKELSNRAVRYTGRLPLALKVLGSSLRGRKAGVWKSALERLAKTQNSEIFETLKLSFDGLEEYEKKIFLDIACFFKGREVDDVTRVLDSFGFFAGIGITSLIEKSLITISKNKLDMHDLIQEMGWQVVQESAPKSRLWKNEEILDFVMKNKKLKLVEAIVNPSRYGLAMKQGFSGDVFKSMKNLRLLDISWKFTCCEPTFLPHDLRWLRWDQYPFSFLPLANKCKLVGLELGPTSKIEHLWNGQKKWAAIDGCLSIGIPGSNILSWFRKQNEGNNITLKLPFKWQTQILGFAICGVFRRMSSWVFPSVKFRFENGGRSDPVMEVDGVNASVDDENESENVWIAYIPFSLLENMHHNHNHADDDDCEREEWSHVIEGNLIIELTSAIHGKAVRCGAQIVYKEDLGSTHVKPSISSSYYWKWKLSHGSQNTIHCW